MKCDFGDVKMRLQRIYSSKLYVTSTRKDRIHAAIQDPINVELVQQLEDYLDDEDTIEDNDDSEDDDLLEEEYEIYYENILEQM